MILFYLTTALLVGTDSIQADIDAHYGYVYIDVMDLSNEPADNWQIAVVDTLGNGELFFSYKLEGYPLKLLPGVYFINAYWTSEGYSDWFHIDSGDSLYFQFNYKPVEYIVENQWPLFEPNMQDTIIIHLTGTTEDGTGILSVNPETFPSSNETRIIQHDQDTYQIAFNTRNPVLNLNFPHLGRITLRVPYSSIFSEGIPEYEMDIQADPTNQEQISPIENNPFTICRLTNDEWLSAEYQMQRTLIDPYEWGDNELTRYGFVAFRGYFENTDSNNSKWRIILAFHKRVVVLCEGTDPVVYNLELGMNRPEFSPDGRYIFYYDKSEYLDINKWAVLLNTATGETTDLGVDSVLADTTSRRRYSVIMNLDGPDKWWSHFPASDGSMLSVFEDSFKYYASGLENVATQPLPLSFDTGYASIRRSSDGNLFYLISPTVYNSLFAVDNTGSLIFEIPLIAYYFALDSAVNTIAFLSDDSIKLWNLQNGSMIQNVINNDGFNRAKLSSNGSILDLSRDFEYFEFRDTHTWELLNSYTIPSDLTYQARLISVSNNATSILLISSRYEARTALFSPEGNLMWLSPSRPRSEYHNGRTGFISSTSLEDFLAISSDGSRFIFNDGAFIQILDFAKRRVEDED